MAIQVVLLFLLLSVIEVSVLLKRKLIREIFVFLVLMAIALTYSISGVSNRHFPGPSALVETVFKPLSQLVFPRGGE